MSSISPRTWRDYEHGDEAERRILEPDDGIKERHWVDTVRLTPAELEALRTGKVLEVAINSDEYTLLIGMAEA